MAAQGVEVRHSAAGDPVVPPFAVPAAVQIDPHFVAVAMKGLRGPSVGLPEVVQDALPFAVRKVAPAVRRIAAARGAVVRPFAVPRVVPVGPPPGAALRAALPVRSAAVPAAVQVVLPLEVPAAQARAVRLPVEALVAPGAPSAGRLAPAAVALPATVADNNTRP